MRLYSLRSKLQNAYTQREKAAQKISKRSNDFAAECRKVRRGRKLCLREVARNMGISPMYLSDLENGKRLWNIKTVELFMFVINSSDVED